VTVRKRKSCILGESFVEFSQLCQRAINLTLIHNTSFLAIRLIVIFANWCVFIPFIIMYISSLYFVFTV